MTVRPEQLGQMIASTGVAELVGEPELTEVAEGLTLWVADAELAFPRGRSIQVVIYPLCAGIDLPYQRGDRVRVIYNHGEAVVVGHFASASDHGGHTVLRPRAGKDVIVGGGSGDLDALALASRLGAEVRNLKAQIDALTAWLHGESIGSNSGGPVVGIPAGAGSAEAAVAAVAIDITGGEAAIGAKGRAS